MALPWLALIKAVPWTDVVAHAPTVLNAAKRLWKPKGAPTPARVGAGPAVLPVSPEARVAELEASLADAQAQLADTNQLVQDMAEQQARMLVQIEDNRRALRRVTGLAGLALLLAAGALWRVWSA